VENAPGVAKALEKFFKDKEKLKLKAGYFDGKRLSLDEISALAKLPSLEALRSQLLGMFKAPSQQIAAVIAAKVKKEETAA